MNNISILELIGWECWICREKRPHRLIDFITHDISIERGFKQKGQMFINVKYCNDNPACKGGAHLKDCWINWGATFNENENNKAGDFKMNWISVKDRLPEHNQFFLGTDSMGHMIVLRCDIHSNGDHLIDYVFMNPDLSHQVTGITHWMPLPEPPKEE